MNNLIVKNVDMFGDTVMAAMDKDGTIWAGVSYFCKALGMSDTQRDTQVEKIRSEKTLSKATRKFPGGVFGTTNEAYALRIDFVPLWLAKISITKRMEHEHPELADKLLQYQLKAKDILADAFLPNHEKELSAVPVTDIPLGELASYLKIMDRVAHRQELSPHKIAENFKKVSEQFGVLLSDDFVKVPKYEQLYLDLERVHRDEKTSWTEET